MRCTALPTTIGCARLCKRQSTIQHALFIATTHCLVCQGWLCYKPFLVPGAIIRTSASLFCCCYHPQVPYHLSKAVASLWQRGERELLEAYAARGGTWPMDDDRCVGWLVAWVAWLVG